MRNNRLFRIILIVFLTGTHYHTFADTIRTSYINAIETLLQRDQYALRYDASMVSNDGSIVELTDNNSVVVRDSLTLYTSTESIDYIVNTQGSMIINKKLKKITAYLHPMTPQEITAFSNSLNVQISNKLVTTVNQCDSIKLTELNGYRIYTTYENNSPYLKAECWINANNQIKEVRYYLNDDSDFLYQRLVYNYIDYTTYLPQMSFSYYIVLNNGQYVATTRYNGYEIVVGN